MIPAASMTRKPPRGYTSALASRSAVPESHRGAGPPLAVGGRRTKTRAGTEETAFGPVCEEERGALASFPITPRRWTRICVADTSGPPTLNWTQRPWSSGTSGTERLPFGLSPKTPGRPRRCSSSGRRPGKRRRPGSSRNQAFFVTLLRGEDLNLRPSGYEPDELPGCSTARRVRLNCPERRGNYPRRSGRSRPSVTSCSRKIREAP